MLRLLTYRRLGWGWLLLLSACSQVVTLDLDEAERQLVVEALLTDEGQQVINLKQSASFYQSAQDPVQLATVTLAGPGGYRGTFTYDAGGNYVLDYRPLTSGQYELTIVENGQTYTSSMTFPSPVELDSTSYEIDLTSAEFSAAVVFVDDEAGVDNYYRVRVAVNGDFLDRPYTLFTDTGLDREDGSYFGSPVYLGTGIESGDTITLQLQSLSVGAYEYYQELSRALNSSNTSGAPFNPAGNLTGENVLGFFGGMRFDTLSYIVP